MQDALRNGWVCILRPVVPDWKLFPYYALSLSTGTYYPWLCMFSLSLDLCILPTPRWFTWHLWNNFAAVFDLLTHHQEQHSRYHGTVPYRFKVWYLITILLRFQSLTHSSANVWPLSCSLICTHSSVNWRTENLWISLTTFVVKY